MNTEITPFSIDSYQDVLTLWRQCEGIGLSDADSSDNIRAYLNRNPEMSFVATADGMVVGSILAGHDGRRGYIHHLAVHPSCRRRGLGRALVAQAICALLSVGIQKAHIFIFNNNAAGIAFWKSVGWNPRDDIAVISKTIQPGTGGDC
ncbi:MAG: GNAT family N-acetyltransferase [Desulforhopalus sp.]|jgi:putative acetyltransferase|nr:GNAT family N-acetyltransferase [Desulforhopalus sp.]